eukprot:c16005_g1_i2.p1 GENE.c16005_g1_i2~~c16005_g1_i2.p1  ORF type:complete len:112 (+),score=41.24 c16005_g1_i2:146-481(+)
MLQNEIFPKLNLALKDQWIRVTLVDLRTGYSKSCSEEIQAISLNEIDSCRLDGNYPWFIALRGERFGIIPSELVGIQNLSNPKYTKWLDDQHKSGKKISLVAMEVNKNKIK